ncbi:D-inositol 3-phosphate glycosyltransferase-like isoform X2 [Montipora foliosa]|uniref:D-inositol 3-phosphate glycosyltransferase-like isoform X2 n=1 Tax=Montipora foliosa TaxID=591990 RepID=UPI0035F1063C
MFKSYPDPISKGEEKHNIEVKLCEEADFVVAIGPKQAESFHRYLRACKKHQTIFDFTPGIFEEFLSVDQDPNERKHRSVLVFGRGDAEDFQLKGFDIAGKAVASLADTHLIFVGAPDGKYQEIAKSFLECDLPANCLRVRGYVKCRESLTELFCEVDLVVMPSRTDGFGLTGLEALSAGLPVLVSKNSGFGESLSKVPFGSSFVIDSEDPKVWAAAIKNIWDKERQSRLKEVKILRTSYEQEYSWTKQSDALLVKIINLVRARLRLQIDCEAITLASAQTGTGTVVTPQQPQEVFQGAREVPSSSNKQHAVVPPSLAAESELYGGISFTEIDTQTVLNIIALRTFQGLDPSTPEQRNEFVLILKGCTKP